MELAKLGIEGRKRLLNHEKIMLLVRLDLAKEQFKQLVNMLALLVML